MRPCNLFRPFNEVGISRARAARTGTLTNANSSGDVPAKRWQTTKRANGGICGAAPGAPPVGCHG
ncbi:MAG: hypothetical protein VXY41_04275, partial [Pseudomonadota bacterium]|nr:hypothetical protein [Pseudomonadota bacterium]